MEVHLIKNLLHDVPTFKQLAPSETESLEVVPQALVAKDKQARDAVAASVKPVKHVIKVQAVQ